MRNRSSAIAITESTKKGIAKNILNNPLLSETQKHQKFSDAIETKLNKENRLNIINGETSNTLDLPTPQYFDIRKVYISQDEKAKIFN